MTKPKDYLENNGWRELSTKEAEDAAENGNFFTTLVLLFSSTIRKQIGKRMKEESNMDDDFEGPDIAILPNARLSDSGDTALNDGEYMYGTIQNGEPEMVKQEKEGRRFWRRSTKKQTGIQQPKDRSGTKTEWGRSFGKWFVRDSKPKQKK